LFARTGRPVWAPDEWAGIWNRPNLSLVDRTNEFTATYHTNAAGLRVPEPGHEYSLEKAPSTFRILLLGPSFAFGWGVDWKESFLARLEQLLEESGFAGGREVEVLNAGVNSLPPRPGLRWFEHVGSAYRPDLVIQLVYGSMAVPSSERLAASVDEAGHLIAADATLGRRVRERVKRLATVFYAWVFWTRLDALRGDGAVGGGEVLGAGRELKAASAFDAADPEVAEALDFYRQLAAAVRAAGGEPLVVYLPLSYVVHPEDVSRWRHLGVRDVETQMAFDAAFVRHLNALGIPALDLTGSLRRSAAGERLYYWLDIHWTAAGNRVAAQAAAEYLTSGGWAGG
jgi:hypothetical protein